MWIAERLGAAVTALHVIDIVSIEGSFLHDISGSLGFEPYLDFSSKMREVLEERGRAMLAEFAERAAEVKVRYETVMDVGVIANEICERARTADVVVIGHRGINLSPHPWQVQSPPTRRLPARCRRPCISTASPCRRTARATSAPSS